MVHTQRCRYQSPHLNAGKIRFLSIETKHNTLLYDAILPPPEYFFFTISIASSELVFTIMESNSGT